MANLFDIPSEIRNRIYKAVLAVPRPLYLFQEPGRGVETFAPDRPSQWLSLLYTNRIVSAEACPVLYKENSFHFIEDTRRQVEVLRSFLNRIGPTNAAFLSSLCINFPIAERAVSSSEGIRFRDDYLQTLTLLEANCPNLSTLEMVVHHRNLKLFDHHDNFLTEALDQINTQLRTLLPRGHIIVRIDAHDAVPTQVTKEHMREPGWTVLLDAN